MKSVFRNFLLLSLVISPLAFADEAPVESLSPGSASASAPVSTSVVSSPSSTLTTDQRIAVLERQISTMNQIDLVNQMSHLEQQVQDLEGQVQVLSHSLQTVQTQTTSQYADLDKRLQTEKTATTTAAASDSSAASDTQAAPSDADTHTDEKTLYEAALKNMKAQKNADAISDMKKYLAKYPDGQHAANAHYWLGQLYILKGDDSSVKAAVSEFNTVIKKYPKSDKVKESNLKLGFAYLLQNKNQEERTQFHKVIKQYPGTATAQLAEARLAQLS
jgi:tol-pal system protein YbgF